MRRPVLQGRAKALPKTHSIDAGKDQHVRKNNILGRAPAAEGPPTIRGECAESKIDQREQQQERPAGCAHAGAAGPLRPGTAAPHSTPQRSNPGAAAGNPRAGRPAGNVRRRATPIRWRGESGESQPQLRITKEADVYLRKMLVQAGRFGGWRGKRLFRGIACGSREGVFELPFPVSPPGQAGAGDPPKPDARKILLGRGRPSHGSPVE